jgi:large subunit ribosomal protein L17
VKKRTNVRRLNRDKGKREALCRNLLGTLVLNGEVHTTTARAKEIRSRVERLITLAKRGDLHARRQALSRLPHQEAIHHLFSELGPRYAERQGGYTRLLRLGTRRGDGATMMMIQLVE